MGLRPRPATTCHVGLGCRWCGYICGWVDGAGPSSSRSSRTCIRAGADYSMSTAQGWWMPWPWTCLICVGKGDNMSSWVSRELQTGAYTTVIQTHAPGRGARRRGRGGHHSAGAAPLARTCRPAAVRVAVSAHMVRALVRPAQIPHAARETVRGHLAARGVAAPVFAGVRGCGCMGS
jgi:hypothetical protein